MSFIGIDLGATFIKGAILDSELGQVRNIHRIPFPPFSRKEGYIRECDTDKILASVVSILDTLLSLDPNCNGLVMCGQMHGLVMCDSFGQAVSPFISWQDQRSLLPSSDRGKTWYELLCQRLEGVDFRLLGNELRPGLPLTHLFYLNQIHELPPNSFPASLMDFILANLCSSTPIAEATNAEAHGFYNVSRGKWDLDIIKRLELGQLLLPEIVPIGTKCGFLQYKGKNIICYTSIGDQQAALLGSGLSFRELSLNISTGSQVSLRSHEFEIGEFQTRPYFDGNYLKTITHLPAGRALNALIRMFIEFSPEKSIEDPNIWSYLDEQVGKTKQTDIKIALTFFNGALGEKGYISHIRESELTIGHLFRAAFESMAENYYLCACRLSDQFAWDTLLFSGGLVKKTTNLQRIIANRFNGIPIRLNSSEEDTLIGLQIMAHSIIHNSSLEQSSQKILTKT